MVGEVDGVTADPCGSGPEEDPFLGQTATGSTNAAHSKRLVLGIEP